MTHDNAASRPVDDVAERFVDDYAALDPVAATYIGLPGFEDRLTDLSPDGFGARADLTRRALAAATPARPTSASRSPGTPSSSASGSTSSSTTPTCRSPRCPY